jgi:hypothetical protein
MLFMVIERFKNGEPQPVGARFRELGRMLPDGVVYHASWMEMTGTRCYQIMEAADEEALRGWMRHWDDLVEFEVIPVLRSTDYWQRTPAVP